MPQVTVQIWRHTLRWWLLKVWINQTVNHRTKHWKINLIGLLSKTERWKELRNEHMTANGKKDTIFTNKLWKEVVTDVILWGCSRNLTRGNRNCVKYCDAICEQQTISYLKFYEFDTCFEQWSRIVLCSEHIGKGYGNTRKGFIIYRIALISAHNF